MFFFNKVWLTFTKKQPNYPQTTIVKNRVKKKRQSWNGTILVKNKNTGSWKEVGTLVKDSRKYTYVTQNTQFLFLLLSVFNLFFSLRGIVEQKEREGDRDTVIKREWNVSDSSGNSLTSNSSLKIFLEWKSNSVNLTNARYFGQCSITALIRKIDGHCWKAI